MEERLRNIRKRLEKISVCSVISVCFVIFNFRINNSLLGITEREELNNKCSPLFSKSLGNPLSGLSRVLFDQRVTSALSAKATFFPARGLTARFWRLSWCSNSG